MTDAKTIATKTDDPFDAADEIINDVSGNPAIVAAITSTASGFSPKVRKGIYYGGIALGAVVAVASLVGAALTGNTADVIGGVGGIAYALSNLLAAAHLNVPVASAVESN